MRRREQPEYWVSVHRLMEAGWYRVGHESDGPEERWRFRYGHTFETATNSQRVVAAPDENTAMRLLLSELDRESTATVSKPVSPAPALR
jgi:hypothetical protein